MGEFPSDPCQLQDQRPVCRSTRWQDAHEAARGPLWRETGKFIIHLLSVGLCVCPAFCVYFSYSGSDFDET